MRAHYFQHVSFEGLGAIEPWLMERDTEISRTALFKGELPPDPEGIDFLIVMGGPMSVNDVDAHPWLAGEKAFLRKFLTTGKPVLGICLGAQLIAEALGSRVYPNSEPEIGWFPLEGLSAPGGFEFQTRLTAFHWHGETFDLPQDAALLARTPACENQAFRLGTRVVGLQFHLETTPGSAAALVNQCSNEMVEAPYVQNREELLTTGPEVYAAAHAELDRLLSALTR